MPARYAMPQEANAMAGNTLQAPEVGQVQLPEEFANLTVKQRRFVEEYCGRAKFNASRAARRAGYSEGSRSIASELMQKPVILSAINAWLDAHSMTAGEVTMRLTQWARGSLEPFVTPDGGIDVTSPEARKNLHLLKRLKVTDDRTEVELHDAKDAVVQMGKIRGLFVDRSVVALRGVEMDRLPAAALDRIAGGENPHAVLASMAELGGPGTSTPEPPED